MKYMWAAVLVLCLTASVSFAQLGIGITARAMGMGSTGIGVADDAAAWFQNPAGLAALNIGAKEGASWANDALVGYATADEMDMWGITWSGQKVSKGWGLGAGYFDVDEGTAFGAGFGMQWKETPLSVGVTIARLEDTGSLELASSSSDSTVFNIGAMYRFAQDGKAPIRVGLNVMDVADELGGPIWGCGVLWPASKELAVAVDLLDLTDEGDSGVLINAGAEYVFNDAWTGRLGLVDDGDNQQLTLGAGYKWGDYRLDVGWQNLEFDDLFCFTAGKSW